MDESSGERVVCRCLQIAECEIVGAIISSDICTLKQLCSRTDAGNGCTACHAELARLLEKHTYASAASPICSVK
jgi:bacterioferritin-associated ferredoxin